MYNGLEGGKTLRMINKKIQIIKLFTSSDYLSSFNIWMCVYLEVSGRKLQVGVRFGFALDLRRQYFSLICDFELPLISLARFCCHLNAWVLRGGWVQHHSRTTYNSSRTDIDTPLWSPRHISDSCVFTWRRWLPSSHFTNSCYFLG